MSESIYNRIVAEAKLFDKELVIKPKTEDEFLAYFGQRLVQLYSKPPEVEEKLTPREIEVLREAKRGLNYKQIGAALNLSKLTVKEMLARIRGKLGASNTIDAVTRATSYGII